MGKLIHKAGSLIVTMLVIILFFTGCQPEIEGDIRTPQSYPLKLTFENYAGSLPLELRTQSYTNPFGEDITFTIYKYYVSNISLVNAAGKETKLPDTYFLVDADAPSSASFTVNAPDTAYKTIRFLLGVDSTRNVSGVQTGALDPANGMFWTWNTGYIMAKMEGTSAVSTAPLSAVTYHIGGFKTGESALRTISLNLPENVILTSTATSEVVIGADAMKWFNGVHDIKIATDPYTMNPGDLAMKIADNYAKMFYVETVINK